MNKNCLVFFFISALNCYSCKDTLCIRPCCWRFISVSFLLRASETQWMWRHRGPVAPATVGTPLSERPLFYAGSGGFCAVTRLWKSYYCLNFFWNLTLGWACSTVFIVMCREDCFCVHYVKKFLFLVAIMSFNLWETNVKKKKKLKRWDQIKVNNVTLCDLILGRCDCNRTLIFILLHWFTRCYVRHLARLRLSLDPFTWL